MKFLRRYMDNRREKRRRRLMVELVRVMAEQAAIAMRDGDRFQVREDVLDTADDWQRFLIRLTEELGISVRASRNYGSITFYIDDGFSEGSSITIAHVER
jgi:hypothetical protein